MEPNQNPQTEAQGTPVAPVATPEAPKEAPAAGMDNKKLYGILGYIIPILFFLPLIDDKLKTDADARFHANQQLILLIAAVGLHFIVGNVLYMVLGPLAYMLSSAVNIVVLVFIVIGVLNVVKGEQKELPVIGKFSLLK